MYSMLVHSHSGLRWVVLILLLAAIVQAGGSKTIAGSARRTALLALIFTHLQIVIGLILYFISPKVQFTEATMGDSYLRFYAVEHITTMIISAIVITLGWRRAKAGKARSTFWFYLIGLIIMLAGIPWPFRGLGGGWY